MLWIEINGLIFELSEHNLPSGKYGLDNINIYNISLLLLSVICSDILVNNQINWFIGKNTCILYEIVSIANLIMVYVKYSLQATNLIMVYVKHSLQDMNKV